MENQHYTKIMLKVVLSGKTEFARFHKVSYTWPIKLIFHEYFFCFCAKGVKSYVHYLYIFFLSIVKNRSDVSFADDLNKVAIKVIRKFFLKHKKSFRWHLGDYEKIFFFPFEGL